MNNVLNKVPKDILIQLVCKSFDNLSFEELLTIFMIRTKVELQKKRDFLLKFSVVPASNFIIQFDSGYLILRKITEPDHILEVLLSKNIDEKCILINIGMKTIGCKSENEMNNCLNRFLSEIVDQEQVNTLMASFHSLVQCYKDKIKIKNFLKLINQFNK